MKFGSPIRTVFQFVARILPICILPACNSKVHIDHTELLYATIRQNGQSPPNWMLLAVGGLAYARPSLNVVACDSVEHFKDYNQNEDASTSGCSVLDSGRHFIMRGILPQGRLKYIVEIDDVKENKHVGFVGADDLSPFIPNGTELVVMNVSNGTDSNASETTPNLLDRNGNEISELLDHTKVRVRGIIPGNSKTIETLIAVTVTSGALRGQHGYISMYDAENDTGDNTLESFLGAAESQEQPSQ